MSTNFDEIIERRASGSEKWIHYPDDVLPMWVADMDFRSAPPIREALRQRVEHGVYGYGLPPAALTEAICAHLAARFAWAVTPEQIVYFPSVVTGFALAAGALSVAGEGLIVQPPVYPPLLHAPANCGRPANAAPLVPSQRGATLWYDIDFDALKAAAIARAGALILCNPHNPTGRVFTRDELLQIAAICEKHDILIIADEIWSDLTLGDATHIPIASLAPEIAARTVTLMAPSKTFNLPGLGLSFGVVTNEALRNRLPRFGEGPLPLPNVMGMTAALAAYAEGDPWARDLRAYLTANRDAAVAYLADRLPQLRTTVPEASYLAWVDCRAAGIDVNPQAFFLNRAKVGLSDGAMFGAGGDGFVRINMGCPRAVLLEGLERMRQALA
ncbi:MAG TPA: PatB family C-S lyase [Herpetosiphonaceae bacterium]